MIVIFNKHEQRIPLKIWLGSLDQIEGEALQQAVNMTELPFAYHHVALMPDVHSGYGVPIGGVLATVDNIIPNAVGFDIGCGVRAALTSIDVKGHSMDHLSYILNQIRTIISKELPELSEIQQLEIFDRLPLHIPVFRKKKKQIRGQLRTLSGGNHFIELQRDEKGRLWITIHAGAGPIGRQTAEYFDQQARELCEKKHADLPLPELSFLPKNTPESQDYLEAMNWCLDFARENRRLLLELVLNILEAESLEEIDIHHNYAALEEHYGCRVWVHRKGAIRVGAGESGVVLGSMGSASYIVKGSGNPESFQSCSHGAGRKMGRREALRNIPIGELLEDLQDRKIEVITDDLGELPARASQTYKDINQVMSQQADLVEIQMKLTPLGVIRG